MPNGLFFKTVSSIFLPCLYSVYYIYCIIMSSTFFSVYNKIMMKNKIQRSVLSKNIIKYRKARGLTQIQLSELSGLSTRMIAYYETNISNPPVKNLLVIANALNVSIYDLLGEKPVNEDIELFDNIDMRTLKKIMLIKNLSKKDRATIYNMIDALNKEK